MNKKRQRASISYTYIDTAGKQVFGDFCTHALPVPVKECLVRDVGTMCTTREKLLQTHTHTHRTLSIDMDTGQEHTYTSYTSTAVGCINKTRARYKEE